MNRTTASKKIIELIGEWVEKAIYLPTTPSLRSLMNHLSSGVLHGRATLYLATRRQQRAQPQEEEEEEVIS
jgi:hypothetical protein